MKKEELEHVQCMEDLQNLFEKKLQYENQQFKLLEKKKFEMRKNFEDQIKVLQRQNDSGIESFLGSFKGNLKLVQAEYEDSKKTADSLKQIYEEKLTQQEDEHEAEIMDEKRKFNELSEELNDKIGVLNNKIGTEDRQIKRLVEEGK